MCHSFLIHLSADEHRGYFLVLAIINSAAMNIGVHVSLSDLVSSRSAQEWECLSYGRTSICLIMCRIVCVSVNNLLVYYRMLCYLHCLLHCYIQSLVQYSNIVQYFSLNVPLIRWFCIPLKIIKYSHMKYEMSLIENNFVWNL